MSEPCRVYWGTHGCHRPRGHEAPHACFDVSDTDDVICSVHIPGQHAYGEDAAPLVGGPDA